MWEKLGRATGGGLKWMGQPAFKTALASTLAWWMAQALTGTAKPYMAVLATVLSLNVTISDSVSRGLQRILGVTAGIATALILASAWGLRAWTVGILVLGSLLLGQRLGLGSMGTPQIAISGLLVWSTGHGRELPYATLRFWDTVIGAAVAILINGLLYPADLTRPAQQELGGLSRAVAEVGHGMADALGRRDLSEAEQWLEAGRSMQAGWETSKVMIRRARESLRWNLWGRPGRRLMRDLSRGAQLLEKNMTQVRSMARILYEIHRGRMPLPAEDWHILAEMADRSARALDAVSRWFEDPHPPRSHPPTPSGVGPSWSAVIPPHRLHVWAWTSTAVRLLADTEDFFRE